MQTLLFSKHRHYDECMKINAFTEHPEIVTAKHVLVKKLEHFAAYLSDKWKRIKIYMDKNQADNVLHTLGK